MKLVRTAMVAACLAASGPVLADASGAATFGSLKVTLIDLDPNDGVDASIAFMPDPRKYYDGAFVKVESKTWTEQSSYNDVHNDKLVKQAARGSANISGTVHTDTATASASVTAAADGFGFQAASISGTASEAAGHLSYFGGQFGVPGYDLRKFMLSANTQVVFSVDASMSVSTGVGTLAGEQRDEMAWARLGLLTIGLAPDGITELNDRGEQTISVGYPWDLIPGGGADSWSGVISSSFSNLGSESALGGFVAYGIVEGVSILTAVPEPATYGMLLGGLGLIGAVARRRSVAA